MIIVLGGNNSSIREYSKKYLTKYTYEGIIQALKLYIEKLNVGERITCFLPLHSIHFETHKDEIKKIKSITNEEIKVDLLDIRELKTLVIGKIRPKTAFYLETKEKRIESVITLREIKIQATDNISNLLYQTIEDCLKSVYGENTDIKELRDKIENSSQVDTKVVQSLILDNISNYLSPWFRKIKKDPDLEKLLNQFDLLKEREKRDENTFIKKELDAKLNEIKNHIIKNEKTQKIIIGTVKETISKYQYSIKSIPFELFQNADDATEELPKNTKDTSQNPKKFVIQYKDSSIQFIHWGRKINDPLEYENRDKYGWHRDLEKMLILMSSGKNYSTEHKMNTTGKFGLGFKSVFLLSDTPRILSGKLCVEIKAGIYPDLYKDENRIQMLKNILSKLSQEHQYQGTVFDIPLSKEITIEQIEGEFNRFQKFAGFLTVFSQQIREIQYKELLYSWKESKRISSSIEKGSLKYENKNISVIYFRFKNRGILFKLNSKTEFEPFGNEEVPRFWVVNPIETVKAVFLVNGDFEVDAGRSRLSFTNEKNFNIGKEIGTDLKKALKEIINKEKELLGLEDHSFWSSFLSVFSENRKENNSPETNKLYKELLRGYGKLLKEEKIIPTGLPGSKELTLYDHIAYYLSKDLEGIFTELKELDSFKKRVKHGNCISQDIKEYLDYFIEKTEFTPIDLSEVFQWIQKDTKGKILSALDNQLGKIINDRNLDSEQIHSSILKLHENGELKAKVLEKLREKEMPHWIRDLKEGLPEFSKLKENEFEEQPTTNPSTDPHNRISPEPTQTLKQIYDWWHENKEEKLNAYIQKIYPNEKNLSLNDDNFSDWLTLFVLGATHRFGGTKSSQHKGYIKKCMDKKWWDTFSNKDPIENFKDWMEVLEDYSNPQYNEEEYEYWMQLFPSIFRLARWKKDYIELFNDLKRQKENFDLNSFLKPRQNQDQQGGGIDSPPLTKTFSLGACFVLREIVRIKELRNEHLYPFCFTPVKRIRDFFELLGCSNLSSDINSSKTIYNFIKEKIEEDKATFDLCFDIPFQIIADDKTLQNKFGISINDEENR